MREVPGMARVDAGDAPVHRCAMVSSLRRSASCVGAVLAVLGASSVGCSSSSPSGPDDVDVPGLDGPVLNHVLSTGQSNAVGFAAHEVLSTEQPYENLMFDRGVIVATRCDGDGCTEYEAPEKLVPLVEGDTYDGAPVETMSSALANEVSFLGERADDTYQLLVTNHGRSGNVYACLRKGGCDFQDGRGYVKAFDDALREMKDAHRLATAAGRPYAVRAVTVVHGESDHYDQTLPLDGTDGTPGAIQTYADALVEWQRDYEDAVHAETGQKDTVPMLVSQMANWNDTEFSAIPFYQLEAHQRAPGKVVLVGATYMLPFGPDCIHYTSQGERRLGEYFGKVYRSVVVEGRTWEPLRPAEVTRDGAVVTVRFHVPVPPLVIDTTQVSDPGAYGFEIFDDDGVFIQSVDLAGDDAVAITLSGEPTGAPHLRYALRATPQTCPGPRTGPRGNLRDSDATPSLTGADLANWAVAFDVNVP